MREKRHTRVVPTTFCWERLVSKQRAGVMIEPPPTPKNPLMAPEKTPVPSMVCQCSATILFLIIFFQRDVFSLSMLLTVERAMEEAAGFSAAAA